MKTTMGLLCQSQYICKLVKKECVTESESDMVHTDVNGNTEVSLQVITIIPSTNMQFIMWMLRYEGMENNVNAKHKLQAYERNRVQKIMWMLTYKGMETQHL